MSKTSPEQRADMVRAITEHGATVEAMAEQYGISTARVYMIMVEAGYRRVWRWERIA